MKIDFQIKYSNDTTPLKSPRTENFFKTSVLLIDINIVRHFNDFPCFLAKGYLILPTEPKCGNKIILYWPFNHVQTNLETGFEIRWHESVARSEAIIWIVCITRCYGSRRYYFCDGFHFLWSFIRRRRLYLISFLNIHHPGLLAPFEPPVLKAECDAS